MTNFSQYRTREVIGLLPAGGQATRISPLPCSKELFPIGFRSIDRQDTKRPKVVSHYLLEKMRMAGIKKAYFVLRPGKWDIPAYFGDGSLVDMNLGYLVMGLPYGPYTLDQAYPFVQDAIVALGYPDILFQPDDAYVRLLARQASGNADVVVGVLPFNDPRKGGMVEFDATGRVSSILEKPEHSSSRYSWCIAVWTPVFTRFMHDYLAELLQRKSAEKDASGVQPLSFEVPIGDVIHAAIANNLHVEAEILPGEAYLDIGTPNDLARAIQNSTLQ